MHGAHLVSDRTDAANPGGDVGGFSVVAPAKKSFEEPGGLIDPELGVHHLPLADLHEDSELRYSHWRNANPILQQTYFMLGLLIFISRLILAPIAAH